jgi:hypothetical protein
VRLIACDTDGSPTKLAQNLANKLGFDVAAPTEKGFCRPDCPVLNKQGAERPGAFVWLRSTAAAFCFWFSLVGCSGSAANRAGSGPQTATGTERAAASASIPPPPSSYNQSCTTDDDCVGVPAPRSAGDCTNCIVAAINTADKSRYDADLAAANRAPRLCPCPFSTAGCVDGRCGIVHVPRHLLPAQPTP